ncbi:MAG: SGNH/GDSL hydrolase family protein [Planctomycetota bacterium]|jgi:lysophospholipase L1-like esterase
MDKQAHPAEFLRTLFEKNEPFRIVALGSSNTEHHAGYAFNWVDWFDHVCRSKWCRIFRTVNAGIGGDTSRGILERFDFDVKMFQPSLVFLTTGGNDGNPPRGISIEEYRDNMYNIIDRVRNELGAYLVLQTYYSGDVENIPEGLAKGFHKCMEVVREVAEDTGTTLFDHMARWEPLRINQVEKYRTLMKDPMHVNPLGNMIMGLDLLRFFDVELVEPELSFCKEGLEFQKLMDSYQ